MVLHSFGAQTKAITASGGKNGKRFEELMQQEGFPVEYVKIKNNLRGNLTIVDKQGLAVKLNERGPLFHAAELAKFEKTVVENLNGARWLMLCGSLPPGVPADFYARIIRQAQQRNVPTLLDTDGDALLHGLEVGPSAVAPNQAEAERLLNRALITRQHFQDAARRIVAMGAKWVVLSLGSRGAVGASESVLVEAVPPLIDAVCPIGAGDALAAAFTWAISEGKPFEEAVRWGVAAGTASAALPGISFANLHQTQQIYSRVELRVLSA